MIGYLHSCGWYHLQIPVDSTNWNQWFIIIISSSSNNNNKDDMKVRGENVEEIKEEGV